MLEELKDDIGAFSGADVMRQAIYYFYQKYHNTKYLPQKMIQSSTGKEQPKPKLTQEQKEEKKRFDICYALGGTIVEKNGAKNCLYKTYEVVNPSLVEAYENQVPFSMLDDSLVKNQFNPSKEECERIMNK
jgi:hypothetical protein